MARHLVPGRSMRCPSFDDLLSWTWAKYDMSRSGFDGGVSCTWAKHEFIVVLMAYHLVHRQTIKCPVVVLMADHLVHGRNMRCPIVVLMAYHLVHGRNIRYRHRSLDWMVCISFMGKTWNAPSVILMIWHLVKAEIRDILHLVWMFSACLPDCRLVCLINLSKRAAATKTDCR